MLILLGAVGATSLVGGFASLIEATVVAAHPAPGVSASARFQPRAITFVSRRLGWAVGDVFCGHARMCLAFRQTKDAGRSWSRAIPAALVGATANRPGKFQRVFTDTPLGLKFAGAHDGWPWGDIGVWSTHNGGRSWQRSTPAEFSARREGRVLDVASAGGKVYVLGWSRFRGVSLEVSAVHADHWHLVRTPRLGLPAGGGPLEGAVVLQGSSGWVVEGNDRGITASARLDRSGHWISWTHPCGQVGNSYTVPVLTGPRDLDVIYAMGGFAYPLSSNAPTGATLGSSWLYSSHDGGRTFDPVAELTNEPGRIGELFAPASGVLLLAQDGGSLVESLDGGTNWATVYRGDVRTLAFASSEEWVAVIETPTRATAAVRTGDGGLDWAPVVF
jgi:photosystem II stability/assembly factor-like uncharacterized protein